MRVGVIADIHANRVALRDVFNDMPAVDALVCAGDVVGYNPWPGECLTEVHDRDIPTVIGNHDRAVAVGAVNHGNRMASAGIQYAHGELDEADLEWLRNLPDVQRCFDGRMKIVHGHPDDPNRYTYPSLFSEEMLTDEEILVMGHTHVQAHEIYPDGIVMNPGSVGQPRDGDPRAAYAVVDLEEKTVEERRVEYDVEAVVEAVRQAGLPEQIGTRLRDGR